MGVKRLAENKRRKKQRNNNNKDHSSSKALQHPRVGHGPHLQVDRALGSQEGDPGGEARPGAAGEGGL